MMVLLSFKHSKNLWRLKKHQVKFNYGAENLIYSPEVRIG